MENKLKNYKWQIATGKKTVYINENDIYPDGTVPAFRDNDGIIWTMAGHTHMGHIGMFAGRSLDEMEHQYEIKTNFQCGPAGEAFDGRLYPEYVLPRGSIWPFGLWIAPATGRFYCFFHNETGWNAGATGYTAFGLFDGEPDFRHIGLMYSDNQGRTWDFDRWVITANEVCFTEVYRPDNITAGGQKEGNINLGSGDFTVFVDPHSEYLYIFYTMLTYEMATKEIIASDVFVARTALREDGLMGDFVKYYNGSFCEPGNLGRETAIFKDGWHSHVNYSSVLECYVMSSTSMNAFQGSNSALRIRTSDNLVEWSEPIVVQGPDDAFMMPYFSIFSTNTTGPHNITGEEFAILVCHNGTDLMRFDTKISK